MNWRHPVLHGKVYRASLVWPISIVNGIGIHCLVEKHNAHKRFTENIGRIRRAVHAPQGGSNAESSVGVCVEDNRGFYGRTLLVRLLACGSALFAHESTYR